MKKIEIMQNKNDKNFIALLKESKKIFYRKKSNLKKIILNLLFLILYTILVVYIVSFINKRKTKSNKIIIQNNSSNSNIVTKQTQSNLDTIPDEYIKSLTNNDTVLYNKVKECL